MTMVSSTDNTLTVRQVLAIVLFGLPLLVTTVVLLLVVGVFLVLAKAARWLARG